MTSWRHNYIGEWTKFLHRSRATVFIVVSQARFSHGRARAILLLVGKWWCVFGSYDSVLLERGNRSLSTNCLLSWMIRTTVAWLSPVAFTVWLTEPMVMPPVIHWSSCTLNTTCTMHLVPALTFQLVCTWCKMYYVAISAYGHMTVASCLVWVDHSWNSTTGISWWGSTERKHDIALIL